jgi:O-antigen biosynthesis protein
MSFLRKIVKDLRFSGNRYRCIVCGRGVRKFFPFSKDLEQKAKSHGFPYDFRRMETLNYENCNCPFCLASDRERLYLIYLERHFAASTKLQKILDFAPSPKFAGYLRSKPFVDYTSADLMAPNVDLHIDICDMRSISADSFDVVICSHVLEHVKDPARAMTEIRRVLKPGGLGIIMVPLFLDVKELVEDPAHNTDALRLQYYGQDDHVRLYSREVFLDQLQRAGFVVDQVTPEQLDQDLVKKNAISANSILYVVKKIKT